MAGYTLGFDDGGAVQDDDDATPTIPTDDAAQDDAQDANDTPDTQSAPANGAQPGFVPGGAPGLGHTINSGVQKIVSYLMGAGSADPQTAKTFEQGIKHENPGINDDDANLLAVHKAGEMGGPAAAWAMVQYNRMSYNAKQSFAQAALNGVDGKTGNAQAAAQAATQAGAHILDGSSTVFTAMPGGQGFTAAVKMPGTDRSVTFQLNNDQMNQWLDTGKGGQWDKVMEEGGVPTTLQRITSSAPNNTAAATTTQPQSGQPTPPSSSENTPDSQYMGAVSDAREDNQDSEPDQLEANPNADQPTNVGKTPSSINLSGSDRQSSTLAPKPYSYGNDLEKQGRARFPNISDEGKRQDFMAGQQAQRSTRINELGKSAMGAASRENVAKARASASENSATTRAGGQVGAAEARAGGQVQSATIRSDKDIQVAKEKANAVLQQATIKARDNETRNRINQARLEINDPNAALRGGQPASPQDILKKYGLGTEGQSAAPSQPSAPAQGSSQPGATQRPANVPQGAKFYQGKWYTRGANGEAVAVQ